MVVNSDITTDIDLAAVFRYHLGHRHPVTLVLCDNPDFNSVAVDQDDCVLGFGNTGGEATRGWRHLTFTGIQVLDPSIIAYLPNQGFAHSIDAFRSMLADGFKIKAYNAFDSVWSDLGSPERYRAAARSIMAAAAFEDVSPATDGRPIEWHPLAGDGSDRRWYRLRRGEASLVMVDHGIRQGAPPGEADSFVHIGRHLHDQGLPVPRIVREDAFSGLAFVEDLGDCHLQTHVAGMSAPADIRSLYREVIDLLVRLSTSGGRGFDPDWTWQTARYDREVIVEKECRYFIEAFVQGYCGREVAFERIEAESHRLADGILAEEAGGFMHRDFQSRNILISAGRPHVIDFQGGRLGPAEYDLASLLIDPYVALPAALRETLRDEFIARYHEQSGKPPQAIAATYRLCALSRNLQILGAFGFLAKAKGKTYFADYIPQALESLQHNLAGLPDHDFPQLRGIVDSLVRSTVPGHY